MRDKRNNTKIDPKVKFTLTAREEQILEMERHGISRRRIAELLGISTQNVGHTMHVAAEKERAIKRGDLMKRKHGDTTLQQARHPNGSGNRA